MSNNCNFFQCEYNIGYGKVSLKKIRTAIAGCLLILSSVFVTQAYTQTHPAELKIQNNSVRHMVIKVMKQISDDGRAVKYSTCEIKPNGSVMIPIYKTGFYYLKTKAVHKKRPIIYSKGKAFKAYVGHDGYSVLTVTYTINEVDIDSITNPLSGKKIRETEFEKDED